MDSPTLYVMNAAGEQFPAMSDETRVIDELNGDQTLFVSFKENEVNEAFIGDLDRTWYIGGVEGPADDKLWRASIPRLSTLGELRRVGVNARLKFIDDMDNDRIYERYDESMTAARFFTLLFDGTPYTFQFQGSFESQSWEGLFDGESRLESFQRGLDRYEMEYELVGNQVYLHPLIERNQPYIAHRRLNASDIEKEEDASEFWTYARGFGDYDGEADSGENGGVTERANLVREYESPLAQLVGRRHAPPVKNGNVTKTETMDEMLKNLVEQSVKVSVTNEFHVLKDYPYAQPKTGDVITVIDDVLQFEAQTRVTKVETVRDAVGKIISQKVTYGGQSISERQKAQLNAAGKFISDLEKGRKTIPFNFQDGASKLATNLLLAARTEVDFTTQGLLLTDKSNPNLVVIVNSAGIGISEDGGQTFKNALTGAGLVADVVTSGTFNTHLARIMGTDGIFIIDGDELLSVNIDNPNNRLRITPEGLQISNDGGATWRTKITGESVIADAMYAGLFEGGTIRAATFEGLNGDYIDFGVYNSQIDTSPSVENPDNEMFRFKVNDAVYLGVVDTSDFLFFMDTDDGTPGFRLRKTSDGHFAIDSGQSSLKFLDGSTSRIQARKSDDQYSIFEAADFVVGSRKGFKKNVEAVGNDALKKILATPIYHYHYKTDNDLELKRTGVMYEESPADIIDPSGAGVSGQAMAALAWKALQEQQETITALEQRIQALEGTKEAE